MLGMLGIAFQYVSSAHSIPKPSSPVTLTFKLLNVPPSDALIFSIHTYYALLLKLIAAEIAYLYGAGKFYKSYIVVTSTMPVNKMYYYDG
jgi:hypothetical protein